MSDDEPRLHRNSGGVSDIAASVTRPYVDGEDLGRHPETSLKARRSGITILLCGTFCLGLGQTILFTVLPPIARIVGLADIMVGIIFTISAIFWVFMSPFWGRKSDIWGRKPVLMIGVGVFSISIGGLAFILQLSLLGGMTAMTIFILLTAFRVLHGGFSSAGPAAAQAYVADRSSRKERAASLASIAASFGLGATLGPGIASVTTPLGPTVPLYIVSGAAVMAFLAIWKFLPERTKPSQKDRLTKLKFNDPRLRAPLLYGVLGGIIMVTPIQLFGFYLIDVLALDTATASQYLGIAFMMSSMAALVSQLVIIQRLKIPTSILLRLAPALIMGAHLLIVTGRDFGVLVFAMALGGLGGGLFVPSYNARMSLSVSKNEQGAVAGIANSAYVSGYIVAPIAAFYLYSLSPQLPFLCTTILAAFLAVYAHFLLRTDVI